MVMNVLVIMWIEVKVQVRVFGGKIHEVKVSSNEVPSHVWCGSCQVLAHFKILREHVAFCDIFAIFLVRTRCGGMRFFTRFGNIAQSCESHANSSHFGILRQKVHLW